MKKTVKQLAAEAKPLKMSEREQLSSELSKVRTRLDEEAKRATYWMGHSQQLESQLKHYQAVWDYVPHQFAIHPSKGKGNSETVPVLMCSDWHCEERVDPRSVLGANEYSLEIAHRSVEHLSKTALHLINLKRAGTRIAKLVLWLGGDFITGHIHEENLSNCSLSPIEAILWAEDRIFTLIRFMLDTGGFEQIIVPCSCGNHARTTRKKHISQQTQTSFEWGLYNHLSRVFKDDPRVKFVLNPGYFCLVDVFDKYRLRFHHGDSIRYRDGVGGLTIPLNKRIAKWNEGGREAYLDCLGHWHTFMPGRRAIVNGSLIGYNAFAQECGFAAETPEQTLFFIEREHGLTGIEPVFVR